MMYLLRKNLNVCLASVAACGLSMLLVSCGDDAKDDDDNDSTATTTVKYTDVSAFIASNCANSGCHDGTTKAGSYDMSTRVGIATKASESAAQIQAGSMPQAGSAQKTAFDADATNKAKVLEWLKAGAPE